MDKENIHFRKFWKYISSRRAGTKKADQVIELDQTKFETAIKVVFKEFSEIVI